LLKLFKAPAALLAWVGRKGTLVVAASIFVGLGVPGLAALVRPWLSEALVAMLILAFLRVDPDELRRFFTQPALIAAATAWIMLVTPALLGVFFVLFGLDRQMPDLFFILVLQMAAPGLTSSPALAALMGLDVALTLASLVVCFALTPLTASFFNNLFLGNVVISPYELGLKLFLIIAGSALTAFAVRKIGGRAFIEAQRERIDGLSVLAMFLFAVAAMDGVTDHFRADPLLVLKLTALAFVLALGSIAITTLIFLRAGRARALAIGIIAGNRNIGLMMAATGFAVPDTAWLYFGLAQFPIYLLPHLLKPLATRLAANR
jgi:BASS family bile acid:Na+ symporter